MTSINPYILLAIGSVFALLYALVIIFGWSKTRHCRRILIRAKATSQIPLLNLDTGSVLSSTINAISITTNKFTDADGNLLSPSDFDIYIAASVSDKYPAINPGDLIFCAKDTTTPLHAFSIPDLRLYR